MRPDSHAARTLRKARTFVTLTRLRISGAEHDRLRAGYALLDQARRALLPSYKLTEYYKLWFYDDEYFAQYRRFEVNDLTADRKFFLRELLKLADSVEGDTAESGVYTGASSWFICEARKDHAGRHWAFDSFEGLSEPSDVDGTFWQKGGLRAAEKTARELLEPYRARVLRGWIPAVFGEAEGDIGKLAFVHIDVDLYEPTRDSLEFFYPRVTPGGIIVCDDYGFVSCPGATQAVDEFMAGRPEPVLHCPTGQGIIIKR